MRRYNSAGALQKPEIAKILKACKGAIVKTINVFLGSGDKVKLGDLGVAKMLNQTANFAHTIVGTPYYLSPELCEEKPYNHKSDIWSLGCVLYEMCVQKHPFEANNQGALILKIVRGKFNPIPSTFSKELSEMVTSLLTRDYKKRPGIQEILEMPAMREKARAYNYAISTPGDLKLNSADKQQSQFTKADNRSKSSPQNPLADRLSQQK